MKLEELCILLKERLEESAGELLAEWGTLVPSHKVQRGFARQARADMKSLRGLLLPVCRLSCAEAGACVGNLIGAVPVRDLCAIYPLRRIITRT